MITARDIAHRLSLKQQRLSWRGRCPACDYPGDTFSVRESKGRLGLFCANGCSRDVIGQAVNRTSGGAPAARDESDTERRARNEARALALWNGSEPVPGTATER